jgi:hypothetical protein
MDYIEQTSFDDEFGRWFVFLHLTGRLYWQLTPPAVHRGHGQPRGIVRIVSNIEPKRLVNSPAWRSMYVAVSSGIVPASLGVPPGSQRFDHIEHHTVDGRAVTVVDHLTRRAAHFPGPIQTLYPEIMHQMDIETGMSYYLNYVCDSYTSRQYTRNVSTTGLKCKCFHRIGSLIPLLLTLL